MKKALSLILAMMLVVGLIPASFASDAPPAEGYTYVFSNAAHTGTVGDTDSAFESNYETNLYKHTIATTVEGVSAPWGFVAQSAKEAGLQIAGMGTQANNGLISIYKKDKKVENVITFNPDGTDDAIAVCFEIKVEKSGEFIPTFNYNTFAYAPVVELFVAPKGETELTNGTLSDYVKSLDAKYRIGVADMSDGTSETYRPRMLSAGNYYFIIVLNGAGKNDVGDRAYHYCWPKSLALLPAQKTYTYDFTSNALTEGYAEEFNAELEKMTTYDITTYFTNLSAFANPPTVDKIKSGEWSVANTRYVYNAYYGEHSRIDSNGMSLLLSKARYNTLENKDAKDTDEDGVKDLPTVGVAAHVIFVLDIPAAGKYKLNMFNEFADIYGSFTEVSFGPATATQYSYGTPINNLYTSSSNKILGWHNSSEVHKGTTANPAESFDINVSTAGKYYVLFTTSQESLDKNSELLSSSFQTLNLSKIVLEEVVDENATYPGDAEVNVNPGNAVASGQATISEEVSVLAKDIDGNEVKDAVTVSGNTATAEKNVGDYEFLYWAKGIGYNQKKVSTDLTYNFTKETEKLWLTAIYRNTTEKATKATFYNANGDIIASVAITNGKVTTPALTNVSLAGYGEVKGWKYASDGVTYGENQEVTVSGDALFVAEYDEPETSIDISVENGTMVVEGGKAIPVFGDKVTVTAPARKDNTKLFNYWKKGEEIVSFDKTYEFCAWEDATLTAVYSDYVPLAESVRKIILGNVGNTYVAEFIGFDGADVLERGIAFATSGNKASFASFNKVIMNSKELNHLSAIDDIDASDVVGYVIDKVGNVYYSK